MKICIAGSRSIDDPRTIERGMCWLENHLIGFDRRDIQEVLHGDAHGVDRTSGVWARENGIPVRTRPAKWSRFGKTAGITRNLEMVTEVHGVVCFWDGRSRGTKHMIQASRSGWKLLGVFDENGVPRDDI